MNRMSPTPFDVFHDARGGNTAAFEALVRRYQDCICAITLSITRDLAASEEVAQDVFLTAWTRRQTLRQPESFPSWIRQIARNKSRAWLRRNIRYQARIRSDDFEVARAPSHQTGVVDDLVRAEELASLQGALDALPDDARELLILYYREDRSTRQVADLLELEEATVRKRLSRARARLKQTLEAQVARTLVRTAPGAAFTASILAGIAAIAPQTARAGTTVPRRRTLESTPGRLWRSPRAGLLAIALAGGLWALWLWAATPLGSEEAPAAPSALGPSETARAERATPAPSSPGAAQEDTDGSQEHTHQQLLVRVGNGEKLTRLMVFQPSLDPSRWFPTPDEAPLPDSTVSQSLQALLDRMAVEGADAERVRQDAREVVELAHTEGVLPLSQEEDDDPWALLESVEVARLELEDLVNTPAGSGSPERIDALSALHSAVEVLAEQTDPALADYGRLYQVYVQSQPEVQVAPGEASASIEQALAQTNDPQVVASVLMSAPILSYHANPVLDPQLLASTRDSVSRIADPAERWAAAQVMVDQAYLHQSSDDVRWWMGLSREASHAVRASDRHAHLWFAFSGELERLSAELADLSGRAPRTWRASLTAAVWACHRADPIVQTHEIALGYDGTWRWNDSRPKSALLTCLAGATPADPAPPPGTDIALTVQLAR